MRTLLSLLLYPLIAATAISSAHALKIDRVILSSNNDPLYIEFWPVVAPLWQAMGIRPTLALIADENCVVDESLGDVLRFAPLPGISEALHSQVIRLFLPTLFPNEGCLISDIDMIPISKEYFVDGARDCPDNAFLVYRDKIEDYWTTKYPMCYVAGKGQVFASIFGVSNRQEIDEKICEWSAVGYGWNTDELLLYQYVNDWEAEGGDVLRLGHGLRPRLDRGSWNFTLNTLDIFYYVDCHCPRPYSAYKKSIDYILQAILERYRCDSH